MQPTPFTPEQNTERWCERLRRRERRIDSTAMVVEGVLKRVVGMTLEAVGCQAPVGGRCDVVAPDGTRVEAEVVGFAGDKLYLMPKRELHGLVPNARVIPVGRAGEVRVGPEMLGRVIDAEGKPLDGAGHIRAEGTLALSRRAINPLSRAPVTEPLDTGIRAINALLTAGRGQRLGLFAGSGVGKSVLLGMMTRFTNADVIVVGLIGERGREVKEFIERSLGDAGLARAVVVASPADDSPLMRMQGAQLATSIAEYFRAEGKDVLLLMDSLTRYAQAQREIALAIGEPPATKGYPPSVFARLPKLVERAGNGAEGEGTITAFYTVLAEGDDQNDPIVDAARAILDGHIVLSREVAESGLYPAIDIEASVSRTFVQTASPEQRALAQRFRTLYGLYRQNQDLISVGAYQPGHDLRLDEAVALWPALRAFLGQDLDEQVAHETSVQQLRALLSPEESDTQ
ncbi:MAG: flagellar protein export ATPase FliI [Pseudomonadota bacterium]